jgi:hypothetical protein
MQVSDQGTHELHRSISRTTECFDLASKLRWIALIEVLLRYVEVQGHAVEDLSEVVVKISGDRLSLVLSLFRHAVGESSQNDFAILQLFRGLLKRAGSEEHLSREEQRHDKGRHRPPPHIYIQPSQSDSKKT